MRIRLFAMTLTASFWLFFAIFFISTISFFSWLCKLMRSLSMSRIALSIWRLFSRRSSFGVFFLPKMFKKLILAFASCALTFLLPTTTALAQGQLLKLARFVAPGGSASGSAGARGVGCGIPRDTSPRSTFAGLGAVGRCRSVWSLVSSRLVLCLKKREQKKKRHLGRRRAGETRNSEIFEDFHIKYTS